MKSYTTPIIVLDALKARYLVLKNLVANSYTVNKGPT